MRTRKKVLRHSLRFAFVAGILGASTLAMADYPAVTQDKLDNASKSTDWLTYYHSYGGESFSPANQIGAANVKHLKMVWSHKFPSDLTQGFEATPIVNGDYMFVTTPKDLVYAFDAATGKKIWSYNPNLPQIAYKTVCCDVVNRGVALYGDDLYVAMLSGEVASFNAQTGQINWKKQLFDPGVGYAFSLAPLAVDGKIMFTPLMRRPEKKSGATTPNCPRSRTRPSAATLSTVALPCMAMTCSLRC